LFASFSFPTSVDLVQTSPYFSDEPSDIPHAGILACCVTLFSVFAGSGSVIFNNKAGTKLGITGVEYSARYWGSPGKQSLAHWVFNMREYKESLKTQASIEAFIEMANAINDDTAITTAQKHKLFALNPNETLTGLLLEAEGNLPMEEVNSKPMSTFSVTKLAPDLRTTYEQLSSSAQKVTEKMSLTQASQHLRTYNESNKSNRSPILASSSDDLEQQSIMQPEIHKNTESKSRCNLM
jgi:hypothetical protein